MLPLYRFCTKFLFKMYQFQNAKICNHLQNNKDKNILKHRVWVYILEMKSFHLLQLSEILKKHYGT